MAEKRVSVRLVAEGGRQVRAELEGIGDAGARGFGRLSTEMELANTRLANFGRKAGIALAAVTVAAAAAGVAMVRSGPWKPSARRQTCRLIPEDHRRKPASADMGWRAGRCFHRRD